MVRVVSVNGRLVQGVVIGQHLVVGVEIVAGNANAQRVGRSEEVNAVGGVAESVGSVGSAATAHPLFNLVCHVANAGALKVLIPGAAVRHNAGND